MMGRIIVVVEMKEGGFLRGSELALRLWDSLRAFAFSNLEAE